MDTLELIKEHRLLVRPALFSEGWRAGVFRGTDMNAMSRAYCYDGTEWEGNTIDEAVALCVAGIKSGKINPAYVELKIAYDDAANLTDPPRDGFPLKHFQTHR